MIFKKELKKIKVYTPGKPIEEVKRSLGLDEVYKLASNEIPFYPSYIHKAVQKEVKNINRYPESGCFYLRECLSGKLGVKKDQLVFGNGSDEIITLSLKAFIEKGDEVIVSYPTFLIYEIQAKISGAEVRRVPLKNLRYWLDGISERISKKTKIVFIANPDNPTGSYLTHKEVEMFLKRTPSRVLVFFDEAYFEFAPSDYPKTIKFLKERGSIIISRTFSKAYGLAGLRIGYGIAPVEIAEVLNKVREPFNINRMAQVAAMAALNSPGFLKKVIDYVNKEKEYLYKGLKDCGLPFMRSATNFVLVDFKKDTSDFYNFLLHRGVIIRELKGWGLNRFFRVTVGKHKENEKFLACLKKYTKK